MKKELRRNLWRKKNEHRTSMNIKVRRKNEQRKKMNKELKKMNKELKKRWRNEELLQTPITKMTYNLNISKFNNGENWKVKIVNEAFLNDGIEIAFEETVQLESLMDAKLKIKSSLRRSKRIKRQKQ